MKIITNSAKETQKFAKGFAKKLKAGDILCLTGSLGSGNTTFIQGLAKGLGVKGKVISPTFVLMSIYKGRIPLYHFDLYRLNSTDDVRALGYEEFFYGDGAAVIEWAERLKELLPAECVRIKIEILGKNKRELLISTKSLRPSYSGRDFAHLERMGEESTK